jgi:hypothetical protein
MEDIAATMLMIVLEKNDPNIQASTFSATFISLDQFTYHP